MFLPHLFLALLSTAGSIAAPNSAPSSAPGPIPHFLTPRTTTLDWNVPRNISSSFLRKRDLGRTPEEWEARAGPAMSVRAPMDEGEMNFRAFVAEKRAQAGRWEDMYGSYKGYPYAVNYGGYNIGVYSWDKNNKCQYRTWGSEKYKWGEWQDLGGYLDSSPAVCSYKPDYMDVYVKGDDDYVWYKGYEKGWKSWENIGGDAKYEPATCGYGKERVDVYVSSKEGECYHKYKSGSKWNSWENLGGYLDGPPKVVAYGQYMYLFVKGTDHQLWSRYYDGSRWGSWKSFGGYLASYPSVYYYSKKIYIYVQGNDKKCWGRTYYEDKDRWDDWKEYGGELKYPPDVVAYTDEKGYEKQEVYITQEDKGMYRKTYENDRWSDDWEYLGAGIDSKPAPVYWDDGKVDIYAKGEGGNCKRCY